MDSTENTQSDKSTRGKNSKTQSPQQVGPVQPKIRYRDQMHVDHHLFKGGVATAKKYDKFGPVKVKTIEHVHYFHTVNSMGMAQKHTNQVAGHLHEVTWETDGAGNLVAKCGPPIKKVTKTLDSGMTKSSYEEIKFEIQNEAGDKVKYVDDHTHQMEYIGSDRLSTQKVQDIQNKNAQLIQASTPQVPEGFEMRAIDRGAKQE